MKGVDLSDQRIQPYDPTRKSCRWFKKLGIHIISRLIFNSYCIYKSVTRNSMTFEVYLLETIRYLTGYGEKGRPVRIGRPITAQ